MLLVCLFDPYTELFSWSLLYFAPLHSGFCSNTMPCYCCGLKEINSDHSHSPLCQGHNSVCCHSISFAASQHALSLEDEVRDFDDVM